MNDSLQDQLEAIRPKVRHTPQSAARADAEAFFQGDSLPSGKERVDWEKVYSEEVKRALLNMEQRDKVESRVKESDLYLRYAITGCLTALAGSCLFMLKQACTNNDKSPKFTV